MSVAVPIILVLLGSAIMAFNIYLYVRYLMRMSSSENWGTERQLFVIPVVLLVLFLLGYLVVGLVGKPDMVVAFILFGGSLFVLSMILFLRRVTKGIQEHEKVKSQLIIAEESNRAKSSFLSVMSHEMRTPLNAIIGTIEVMRRQPDLTPLQRERLDSMGASADHLLSLIKDVLDMNRIERGQMELADEPFVLQHTLDQVSSMFEGQCQSRGLNFKHTLVGECSACYRGDEAKLRQVLINILDNAVKFTNVPGTVSFTTEILAHFEGRDAVRFTITDTGIGIGEEYLPKLFSAFSQEDAAITSRYGGSGLGMAISKNIMDMMGGEIAVASKKGEGSTFTVTVTLRACAEQPMTAETTINDVAAGDAATGEEVVAAGAMTADAAGRAENFGDTGLTESVDDAQETADSVDAFVMGSVAAEVLDVLVDASASTATISLEGLHMLIAEDVDINAEILADILDMEGVTSERAMNGQDAVDMFAKSEPGYFDAVLMDIRMPAMDGLMSARTIRTLERPDATTVPIIAITANAFEEDVQRSLQAGMNAHLSKPIDPDELFEALQRLCSR